MTDTQPHQQPVPTFINPKAGSAAKIREALADDARLALHFVEPDALPATLQALVEAGVPRVLVSGGDGTLALAANSLAHTQTALGIIPGGTLNHFAKYLQLPLQPQEAVELALNSPHIKAVDLGCLNERFYLNTSSVGAYVHFVRMREYLEKRYLGYYLASLLALVHSFIRLRFARLWINQRKLYSPLVYMGAHPPSKTSPYELNDTQLADGQGLQQIIVNAETRTQLLKMIGSVIVRRTDPLSKTKQLDCALVDSATIMPDSGRAYVYVALDGEITRQVPPLHYRYEPNALRVIVPAPKDEGSPD